MRCCFIILVQGFCPLKIDITHFPDGFRLKIVVYDNYRPRFLLKGSQVFRYKKKEGICKLCAPLLVLNPSFLAGLFLWRRQRKTNSCFTLILTFYSLLEISSINNLP